MSVFGAKSYRTPGGNLMVLPDNKTEMLGGNGGGRALSWDELQRQVEAPPPPLSDEARKMVNQIAIQDAEAMRDQMRVTAAARLAAHDEWCKTRETELDEEEKQMLETIRARRRTHGEWCKERRANLEREAEQLYDWGDEHVTKVIAEEEEKAKRHAAEKDIFEVTRGVMEKHGVPLPPPRTTLQRQYDEAQKEES